MRVMKDHELDFRVREIRIVAYGATRTDTEMSLFKEAIIEGQQPWNQNSYFARGVVARFEKKMGNLLRGKNDDGETKRKTRKKKSLNKQWTRKKRGKGGPSVRTSKAKKSKS